MFCRASLASPTANGGWGVDDDERFDGVGRRRPSIGGDNCFGILNMRGGVISNLNSSGVIAGATYVSGGGQNTSTGSGMINLTGGTLQSGTVFNGQLSTGYTNVNGGTFMVNGDFNVGRSNGYPNATTRQAG